MASIFSCSNLSKSYNNILLFDDIFFGMEEGERIGIIGRNGVGKSTLLKIISGIDFPDSGTVAFNKSMRYEYLHQVPFFEKHETVLGTVMSAKGNLYEVIKEYEKLLSIPSEKQTEQDHRRIEKLTHDIDEANGWNLENEAKTMLHQLGMDQFDSDVTTLSGGQRKRVALAKALLSNPDLLILDEPTNHLDADSVQWLQDRIQNSTKALLLITHDRYFLDAVTNRIVELDNKKLNSYYGTYERYLEKKEAEIIVEENTAQHVRNKLRTELAWLQRGAKARRTKQKSRIDWIAKIKSEPKYEEQKNIKIEVGNVFLGSKVIDAINISKSIGEKILFKNFTLTTSAGDRIGIIGANGTGKTTLLNTLVGKIEPDSGTVKIGSTVKIGYFNQENSDLSPEQTLIGSLKEVAEYIDTGVGRERYLTASDLLERFLFSKNQFYSKVADLSGGERRRLALLRILMGNPNVLILDEPTNDFDIATLGSLEEYLQNFLGCLIVVSHDRAFLDRAVDFIYAFEENGTIKQYPGNYSNYLEKKELQKEENKTDEKSPSKPQSVPIKESKTSSSAKIKLTYKEQQELNQLNTKIAELETEKSNLENEMENPDGLGYEELMKKTERISAISQTLDELMERWMELESKVG